MVIVTIVINTIIKDKAVYFVSVFKTRLFHKWAVKQGISDDQLVLTIQEIENGQIDANYGGGLYKKRVANKGRGKRKSARTLLAVKINDRAFFLYGFEKNQRANITDKEKTAYKILAKNFLNMTNDELNKLLEKGSLVKATQEKMEE